MKAKNTLKGMVLGTALGLGALASDAKGVFITNLEFDVQPRVGEYVTATIDFDFLRQAFSPEDVLPISYRVSLWDEDLIFDDLIDFEKGSFPLIKTPTENVYEHVHQEFSFYPDDWDFFSNDTEAYGLIQNQFPNNPDYAQFSTARTPTIVATVPEPTTLALLGLGALGLYSRRKRR